MPNRLTQAELAEIRQREQAATPGPFRALGGTIFCDGADEHCRGCFIIYDRLGYSGPECNREADSQFFAAARSDVPRLLAEVDALKAELERLRTAWKDWEVTGHQERLRPKEA